MAYHALTDQLEQSVLSVHKRYGDVVRVGPKTVLAAGPEAVQKVFGYGDNHLSKSKEYLALVFHRPFVLSEVDKQSHARKRRTAALAYSMQSVMKMHTYVESNMAKFIQKVDALAAIGKEIGMCLCFKFFAFDVIGDLAFGQSFGVLEQGEVDEFVKQMSAGIDYTFLVCDRPGPLTKVKLHIELTLNW